MAGRKKSLYIDLGSRKGSMEFQLALNPALRGYVEDGAFRGNIKYMLFVKFNFYSRRSPKQFVQFFSENFPCIGKENQLILERV